jgi:hypothetical protein
MDMNPNFSNRGGLIVERKKKLVMVERARIVSQLLHMIHTIALIEQRLQNESTEIVGLSDKDAQKLLALNKRLELERNDLIVDALTVETFLNQHFGKTYIEVDVEYATDWGWLDISTPM